MGTRSTPTVLVATWSFLPNGRIAFETFEMYANARPHPLLEKQRYNTLDIRPDDELRTFTTGLPVSIATWLHRSGAWDLDLTARDGF